jgi:hypothetical protein
MKLDGTLNRNRKFSLTRNRDMNRADSLLHLDPRREQMPIRTTPSSLLPISSNSGLWYKVLGTFAVQYMLDSNNPHNGSFPGTSAIFKILQERPTIVGPHLQASMHVGQAQQQQVARDTQQRDETGASETPTSRLQQKRRRLS